MRFYSCRRNVKTVVLKWVITKGQSSEQRVSHTCRPYYVVFILPYHINLKHFSCSRKGTCPIRRLLWSPIVNKCVKQSILNHLLLGRMLAARLPYMLPLKGRRRYGCPGSQLTCSTNIRSVMSNITE